MNKKDFAVTNVDLRAEENLGGHGVAALDFLAGRFHELADDRNLELTDKVSHEDKTIFEDADGIEGLADIVSIDLASNVGDTPLNLFGGDDGLQRSGYTNIERQVLTSTPEMSVRSF